MTRDPARPRTPAQRAATGRMLAGKLRAEARRILERLDVPIRVPCETVPASTPFRIPPGWCAGRGFGISARALAESVAAGAWNGVPVRRFRDAAGRDTHPRPTGADDPAWHVGRVEAVEAVEGFGVRGLVVWNDSPHAAEVRDDVAARLAAGLEVAVSIVAAMPRAPGGWALRVEPEFLDVVALAGIPGARLVPTVPTFAPQAQEIHR